ncbi:MAG: serine/threonine protein phosphatase PrpC [Glaciecola sp.]|jgi:serine/threonine protein phosphatase PrpC
MHSCGGTFVDGWCVTCGDKQPAAGDHVEMDLAAIAGAVSDKGLRHAHNEDGFALELLADGTVIGVVCDGVSSTVVPEEASAEASAAAAARLRVQPSNFVAAHADALAAVRAVDFPAKLKLGPPSCTFLAASVIDGQVRVAGVGDCRAYWLPSEGAPVVLTVDDSWVQEQLTAGSMTLVEAMADRRAHVITRWLGRDADEAWRPRVHTVDPPAAGLLVLCSDGLWNYLDSPVELANALGELSTQATPTDQARHLVDFALQLGGRDNITVLCIPVDGTPDGLIESRYVIDNR